MAILAFMRKLLPGQKLHLHTILEPNWARSEAPLNNTPQCSICQELKRSTSMEVPFKLDVDRSTDTAMTEYCVFQRLVIDWSQN